MFIQNIKKYFRLAQGATGLTRENLLLRALNEIFANHVVTECEWQDASPDTIRIWREQIEKLLDATEFAVVSADAYSGEATGLSENIEALRANLNTIKSRIENLSLQRQQLQTEFEDQKIHTENLQKEIELLKQFKTLLPLRTTLHEILGVQKLHNMANKNLIPAMQRNQTRLKELQNQVQTALEKQDKLLKEEIELNEKEWAEIREKIG